MVAKAYISNFGFGCTTGNLTSRTGMVAETEKFIYNNLNRLKQVKHNEVKVMSMDYAANGNIASKTGLGEYAYHPAKPHAVEYIDNTAGLLNTSGQAIEYNAFNKATLLKDKYSTIINRRFVLFEVHQFTKLNFKFFSCLCQYVV